MPDYRVTIELDVFDQKSPLQAALWLLSEKRLRYPVMMVGGFQLDLEAFIDGPATHLVDEVLECGLELIEVEAVMEDDGSVWTIESEGGSWSSVAVYFRLGPDWSGTRLCHHLEDYPDYESAMEVVEELAEQLCVPFVLKPSLKLAGLITD